MDQGKKQAVMMAVLAFNITFILFTLLFNMSLPPLNYSFSGLRLLLGLLVAGGAAAGGYFAAKMNS
jgi:hypothetical protein